MTLLQKIYTKYSYKDDEIKLNFNKSKNEVIKNIIKDIITKKEAPYFKITSDTYLNSIKNFSGDWFIELDTSIYNNKKLDYSDKKNDIEKLYIKYMDNKIKNNINYLYEFKKNIDTIYKEYTKQHKKDLEQYKWYIELNNSENKWFNIVKSNKRDEIEEEYLDNLIFNIDIKEYENYIDRTINFFEWNISNNDKNNVNKFIREIDEGLELIDFISYEEDIKYIKEYKLNNEIPVKLLNKAIKKIVDKKWVFHIWWIVFDDLKVIKDSYKINLKTIKEAKDNSKNKKKNLGKYIQKELSLDKEFIEYIKEENNNYEKIINFLNKKWENIYQEDFYYFVLKQYNDNNIVKAINMFLKKNIGIDIESIKWASLFEIKRQCNSKKIKEKDWKKQTFIYYNISDLFLLWYETYISFNN